MIDELPVEVLDAPLDLALVLRVRRKRKMSVDAEKLNNLLHAQTIRRRLNSYNFDAGLDYGKTTGSKHQKRAQLLNKRTANCLNKRIRFQAGTTVSTIPLRLVETKNSSLSRFMMASPYI